MTSPSGTVWEGDGALLGAGACAGPAVAFDFDVAFAFDVADGVGVGAPFLGSLEAVACLRACQEICG